MRKIESLFDDVYESIQERRVLFKASNAICMSEKSEGIPSGPQSEYRLQYAIRPLYGKNGINSSHIGTHPDFIDLESSGSGTVYHYACTLFVDIKGSTRLSILYPLELVYNFKNAVIQTCVEVIRSLDGHVHRLMGDAVMAFFGGNGTEKEDAIADAINCAITLRAVLDGSIKPWMERNGIEAKDFGFRVGCDFGDDSEVLWGNYGYSNVGEVTATGLPVDMASKLQGLANKNQTMLGQGLLNFVNWPEKYSKIKESIRSGEKKYLPVVVPNLTNGNGVPIDYSMRLLNYDALLECSALPRHFRASVSSRVVDNSFISYKCYTCIGGNEEEYITASRFLDKGIDLIFKVVASTTAGLRFPLRAVFTKTNQGEDVPEAERDVECQPVVRTLNKTINANKFDLSPNPFSFAKINEYTAYRGLHTMKVEVSDSYGEVVFRDWIGVMIK